MTFMVRTAAVLNLVSALLLFTVIRHPISAVEMPASGPATSSDATIHICKYNTSACHSAVAAPRDPRSKIAASYANTRTERPATVSNATVRDAPVSGRAGVTSQVLTGSSNPSNREAEGMIAGNYTIDSAQGRRPCLGNHFLTNSDANLAVAKTGAVKLSLTRKGGSGFASVGKYAFGTFSMKMKLMRGYSAGVCATFFLQANDLEHRNEWDFEFLGSATNSSGMNVQTNYWENGIGFHEVIVPFTFDPAADFHTYTIDWSLNQTMWLIDGVEIRRVPYTGPNYPASPMRVFGSIWNASEWATGTRTHRIPLNLAYAPFTVEFDSFTYAARGN